MRLLSFQSLPFVFKMLILPALIQRLEFIVHANQGILDIRFGTENTTAATGHQRRALRTKAHEIVFSKH